MDQSPRTIRGVFATAVLATSLVFSAVFAQSAEELLNPEPADWPTYGRTLNMTRFSPLDQINSDNASDLRLAWSLSQGEYEPQSSPVVYDGTMYVNSPDGVLALDAATGEQLWQYAAELHENTAGLAGTTARGSVVVYEGNVFQGLADGRVVALDAETGEEVWSSQVADIDLGEGFSAGPIFADGKIILGPAGGDVGGVPGRVIAMDTENGEVLWTFNTVPQPGEPGFESWDPPSSAQWGGGSAWVPGVYDDETGTVIYGVGNATPWHNFEVRGDVSPDLYTGSWVALDVETGELKWYHQVVPGEEWDYDLINTPIVTDLEIDGETRRVGVFATVTGFVVLLDVDTGEYYGSHQMMPEVTIHAGYEDDGTPIIDDSYRFTEEGQTQLVCGFRWVDWEPAAYSPDTGLYYRPNTNHCSNMTAYPQPDDWAPGQSPITTSMETLVDRFEDYGRITAMDPVSGEIAWEFTLDYSQRSGPAVTGGNLVFIGSPDRHFRAFDAETGEVVWDQILPGYITAHPVTYAVDDKQYVAIQSGGMGGVIIDHTSDATPLVTSDVTMFVFALPDQTVAQSE